MTYKQMMLEDLWFFFFYPMTLLDWTCVFCCYFVCLFLLTKYMQEKYQNIRTNSVVKLTKTKQKINNTPKPKEQRPWGWIKFMHSSTFLSKFLFWSLFGLNITGLSMKSSLHNWATHRVHILNSVDCCSLFFVNVPHAHYSGRNIVCEVT